MKIFMKVFCFSIISLFFSYSSYAYSKDVNMIKLKNLNASGVSANIVIHGPNNKIHHYPPIALYRTSNTDIGVAVEGDITVVVQSLVTTQGGYKKFEFKSGECVKELTNYWGSGIIQPTTFEFIPTPTGGITCVKTA